MSEGKRGQEGVGIVGHGTLEFLFDPEYFFLDFVDISFKNLQLIQKY